MTVELLGPSSDAWDHHPVVAAIAASSAWPTQVEAYLRTGVVPAAHDLAHPHPVYGCPGCPQSGGCPSCGKPAPECKNPAGHDRVWREGEASLLQVGVGHYGRSAA